MADPTQAEVIENTKFMNDLLYGHSPAVTQETYEHLESYPGDTAVVGQLYKFNDMVIQKVGPAQSRFFLVE
jgi:hypothetical protein